jgi:hypothetical protein
MTTENATEKKPKEQKPVICPFTVLIDTAEQLAFQFTGLKCDADKDYRPRIVHTERRCLGRHPVSLGDYSLYSVAGVNGAKFTVDGVGRCHIERKSLADLHSTLLGFADGHRERFEQELRNLNEIDAATVIVEASEWDVIRLAPEYGVRSRQKNARILDRSLSALRQDFPRVPWQFCNGPRHAELRAFYWLNRWYSKQIAALKADELLAAL